MRSLRYVASAAVFLCAVGANAQSVGRAGAPLTVSPDTLFYPTEDTVIITNETSVTVAFDSVVVSFYAASGYYVSLTLPDTTFAGEYLIEPEPGIVAMMDLAPGETATFRIGGFDPCVICDGGSGFGADTLLVYSGGTSTPDTSVIDLSNYVSSEPPAVAPSRLRLSAFPNPAAEAVTLTVEGAGAGRLTLDVFDVLGRRVGGLNLRGGEGGAVPLDVRALPAGVYFARARTPDGGRATLRFAVSR